MWRCSQGNVGWQETGSPYYTSVKHDPPKLLRSLQLFWNVSQLPEISQNISSCQPRWNSGSHCEMSPAILSKPAWRACRVSLLIGFACNFVSEKAEGQTARWCSQCHTGLSPDWNRYLLYWQLLKCLPSPSLLDIFVLVQSFLIGCLLAGPSEKMPTVLQRYKPPPHTYPAYNHWI